MSNIEIYCYDCLIWFDDKTCPKCNVDYALKTVRWRWKEKNNTTKEQLEEIRERAPDLFEALAKDDKRLIKKDE